MHRTVDETIVDMGPLSDADIACLREGYGHGQKAYRDLSFAHTYEPEIFGAARCPDGTNGFYRVGFFLGLCALYDGDEVVLGELTRDVVHYRAVLERLGVEL